MTSIDLKALIDAAKKATPGPWVNFSSVITSETAYHSTMYGPEDSNPDRRAVAYCGDEIRARMGLPYGDERDANAAFIALANPSTVAAMAEELLKLRSAASEVIAQNRDYLLHLNNGAQTDPLTRAIDALSSLIQEQS